MFKNSTDAKISDPSSQSWPSTYPSELHSVQSSGHDDRNDLDMLSWLQSMQYMRSNTPRQEDLPIRHSRLQKFTSHLSKTLPSSNLNPSAPSKAKPCLACGKEDCKLLSHKHYSQHMKRLRSPTASTKQVGTQYSTRSTPKPLDIVPPALPSNMEQRVNAEQQYLLGLWSQKWSAKDVKIGPERHLFPISWIDKALPVAKRDSTLRQALCALSAISFSINHDAIEPVAVASLEAATLALSNACPNVSNAVKDENLLAAAMIGLAYANVGDDLNFKQHYERLVQLVKRRGGLHYLGISGILAETLMYMDYLNSIMYDCEPAWALPIPPLDLGLPPQQGQGFRSALATNSIDPVVVQSACSLAKIADILSLYGQPRAPATAIAAWGYLRTVADCQLATCNVAFDETATLEECVCLALNLLNLVVMRFDGFILPLAREVEKRLWETLSLVEAKIDIIGTNPALYLWMLATGVTTLICDTCVWRAAAVGKIRVVSQLAGIHSWHLFREEVLEKHIWLSSAQEEVFAEIWLEAASLPAITV